jgi:hypothetical protein
LRIPVYQTRDFRLADIITEINPYTALIDDDITQDTDNNGVYDDDFVASSSGMSITGSILSFGPYTTIGKKNMMMKVRDEYYNSTIMPISVEVYSSVPRIQDII